MVTYSQSFIKRWLGNIYSNDGHKSHNNVNITSSCFSLVWQSSIVSWHPLKNVWHLLKECAAPARYSRSPSHSCVHPSVCLVWVERWTRHPLLFSAAPGLSWIVPETVSRSAPAGVCWVRLEAERSIGASFWQRLSGQTWAPSQTGQLVKIPPPQSSQAVIRGMLQVD